MVELSDVVQRLGKNDTRLKEVNLNNKSIGDEGAKALANALRTNSTVTVLNLGDNSIGDEGAKALSNALLTNSTLTELDLSDSSIEDEGAKALADVLLTNSTLTELNLSTNCIGAEGAKALANALLTNSTLTELNLGANCIDEEICQAIKKALSEDERKKRRQTLERTSVAPPTTTPPPSHSTSTDDNSNSRNHLFSLKHNEFSDNINVAPCPTPGATVSTEAGSSVAVVMSPSKPTINATSSAPIEIIRGEPPTISPRNIAIDTPSKTSKPPPLQKQGDQNALNMQGFLTWTKVQVGEWLEMIGLGERKDIFLENDISGSVLFGQTTEQLEKMCGVFSLSYGHMRQLDMSVIELKTSCNGDFAVRDSNDNVSCHVAPAPVEELFNGRYKVEERVRGGQHRVLLCMDMQLNKPVALKLGRVGDTASLEREMDVLSLANAKEHLVEVEGDPQLQHDPPYIVLERASTTLSASLEREGHQVSLVQKKAIIEKVLASLHFLHSRKVVHADIKPQNVALFGTFQWKLLDLDGALDIGQPLPTKYYTTLYAAPEILLNSVRLSGNVVGYNDIMRRLNDQQRRLIDDTEFILTTPAQDIWAVGMMLLEIVLGRPVFATEEIARKHLLHMTPDELGLPFGEVADKQCRDLLQYKLLVYDPSKRVSAEGAFYDAFFRGGLSTRDQDKSFDHVATILECMQQSLEQMQQSLERIEDGLLHLRELTLSVAEKTIPSLFILVPYKPKWKKGVLGTVKYLYKKVKHLGHDTFRLHLLCQGNSQSNPAGQVQHWHIVDGDEGYKVKEPHDFLKKVGPFLKIINKILAAAAGVAAAGVGLGGLSDSLTSVLMQTSGDVASTLADITSCVDNLLGTTTSSLNTVNSGVVETLKPGPSLRKFHELLKILDPKECFSGLTRKEVDGDICWYCNRHFT